MYVSLSAFGQQFCHKLIKHELLRAKEVLFRSAEKAFRSEAFLLFVNNAQDVL